MYILSMRNITIFITFFVIWSCDDNKGDKSAPEVTIISPQNGSIVNEYVSIIGRNKKLRVIEMERLFENQNLDQLLVGHERMHLSVEGHKYIGNHLIKILKE